MKSTFSNFALSLILLSTSATLTTAIPAPLPAATGYSSNSEEGNLAAQARSQLRPVWRPGPRLNDAASSPTGSPSSGLSARQGPVFRRNAESKFQYRKRTSAGLAVVGNLAYGLGERDVASPFGISGGGNHVPLPVAMRVRREASLLERDEDEQEDWDCSEYDDEEDDGDDQEEQWSAPASSSESASSSSSEPAKENAQSSSSAPAPAASNDSSNENSHATNPLLTNNVIGTKKEENGSHAKEQESPSSSSAEQQQQSPSTSSTSSQAESTPTTEAAWIAPAAAPENTQSSSSSNVFLPESTKKVSLKKTHSKSKASNKANSSKTQLLEPKLTTPSDVAPGTLTVEQGCTRYHTVVSGEVCLGLLDWSKDLNLTLEQLYSYNPAIDSDCMNLQIGWGVCIGANTSNATSTTSTSSLLRKRNVQWRL